MEEKLHKIKTLKSDIEENLGRSVKSPIDFNHLSYSIKKRTREEISISTLKRIWEYVPSSHKPRNSTLSLLSRYLGYRDWDNYCLITKPREVIESTFIIGEKIISETLSIGCRIEIGWNPNRYCLLEFIGNSKFVVIDVKYSKLQIGDTFSTTIFEMNRPLVITDLIQMNSSGDSALPTSYIAGYQTGLTLLSIVS